MVRTGRVAPAGGAGCVRWGISFRRYRERVGQGLVVLRGIGRRGVPSESGSGAVGRDRAQFAILMNYDARLCSSPIGIYLSPGTPNLLECEHIVMMHEVGIYRRWQNS